MPTRCYIPKKFTEEHEAVIRMANVILGEAASQGLTMTLRQLYYRFVTRNFFKNEFRQYKRLGSIIADARLAGRIDWDFLEDRIRNLQALQKFDGPQDAMDKLHQWYHIDMWKNQKYRPEVWIEKDALSGVIRGVCEENDVPYFCCRGYTSLSEVYGASLRLNQYSDAGQIPFIIHFGDHDPSGMDMSRDIVDRLHKTFMTGHEFIRVALNMDQVEEYGCPPNPAKVTDSRFQVYMEEFGEESWELDALDPPLFRELIESRLSELRNPKNWEADLKRKKKVKDQLGELAKDWGKIDELKKTEKKLSEVISAAHEAGWNGVENSKVLTGFIKELAEDKEALEKELADLKKKRKIK